MPKERFSQASFVVPPDIWELHYRENILGSEIPPEGEESDFYRRIVLELVLSLRETLHECAHHNAVPLISGITMIDEGSKNLSVEVSSLGEIVTCIDPRRAILRAVCDAARAKTRLSIVFCFHSPEMHLPRSVRDEINSLNTPIERIFTLIADYPLLEQSKARETFSRALMHVHNIN